MPTDLTSFGRFIRFRREELGLTQLDVSALGGPSNTTLTKIENGEEPPPSSATLRKLDKALGWQPGAAKDLLEMGYEPIPVRHPFKAAEPDRDTFASRLASRALVTELGARVAAYEQQIDDLLNDNIR